MEHMDTDIQKAIVLYFSDLRFADIQKLPEVTSMRQSGAMVELEPLPITGPLAQHYQALSGHSPASSGFFDTLIPRNYVVIEETTGRGNAPQTLPDLLRTVGWTVRYEEAPLAELASCIESWSQASSTSPACLIIRCSIPHVISDVETSYIAQSLQIARSAAGETGLLALLSEAQPVEVKRFINLNNFLAEMGIIECDEEHGTINWENSLAYYVGHGQIWLNLLGRDSQGAVHPQDEYEEVRETLIKALPAKLKDGEDAVIERVYRKEELYPGEYLFCAPDLVVIFKHGYAPSPASTRLAFDDETFTTPVERTVTVAGVQPSSIKGFLLASAPSLASDTTVSETASLLAVVPTLLHAFGVEYVGMESPAVSNLFAPAYLESHPVRSDTGNQELSDEDEERIFNHLRDLGYV